MGNPYCSWKREGCGLFGAVGGCRELLKDKDSYNSSSEQQDKAKEMLKSFRTAHVVGHIPVGSLRRAVWFISSFCCKLLISVSVSFPSLLVPCIFFFISLCIAFTFSSILQPYSTISVGILITNVLNSASYRLAVSSLLSSSFGALICFFSWPIFFCLGTPVML